MAETSQCHILTIGWEKFLIDGFFGRIAEKSCHRFSHLSHPKYTPQDWPGLLPEDGVYFFRQAVDHKMPDPDRNLLASLECDGVPTIHNMIMGDRVVSKLSYDDAISYATFLARRMIEEFSEIKPSIVIGAYDGMHGSLALAVCRYLNIPWFSLHFSVIPSGLACFCDKLMPAARVNLAGTIDRKEELARAECSLQGFERREIQAPAYIAPKPLSFLGKLRKVPKRIRPLILTLKKRRYQESIKYTEAAGSYSLAAVLKQFWNGSKARRALADTKVRLKPPEVPYVFFGLHMQPESTVDVWAPFYSNQLWVLELLARSIPPSHKLLIKIHKSDVSNYSRRELDHVNSLPGVEIVCPFADTQQFIRKADLVVSIQGTIGLEGALLGKPVIMLGDSPNVLFDSVSRIGNIVDLPDLVRKKLNAVEPDRQKIVEDYATFMTPFMPASNNCWDEVKTDKEIDGYVELFDKLRAYVDADKERHS